MKVLTPGQSTDRAWQEPEFTTIDWFDPRRLRDDYVPTGFKGDQVTHRAVPGHEFGLKLSPGRQARPDR